MGDPMSEPMRDTLARIDALRERATTGKWKASHYPVGTSELHAEFEDYRYTCVAVVQSYSNRNGENDIDLIVAEHNAYLQAREMLERARDLIASGHEAAIVGGSEGTTDCALCGRSADWPATIEHSDRCEWIEMESWLADYEGRDD